MVARIMDNPIVKIPRLLPVVDKINQRWRNVEANFEALISFGGLVHRMGQIHFNVLIYTKSTIYVLEMDGPPFSVFKEVDG